MFWGLIMEPGKKYSQTVEKSFHVSQAALDLDTAQNECVQVLLGFESRNYLLCTLQRNKWVQSNLDLNFQAGDCVSFATNGPGHVHLTGYLVPEDDYDYMDEDEEEDDEQVPVLVDMPSKKRKASEGLKKEQAGKPIKKSKTELLLEQYAEADTDDSDDSDVDTDVLGEESDIEEEAGSDDDVEDGEGSSDEPLVNISAKVLKGESPAKQVAKTQKGVSPGKQAAKNQKGESPNKQAPKSPKGESPKQNGVAKTPKSEKKLQKQEKTPKNDKQQKLDKTPKSEIPPKSPTSSGKKAGGVIIEELKVGEGQQAKPGKFATVYYEGRLKTNNKVFDSSVKGPGFKFRLGKQEVIKGWDVGVSGMKVGGKRRITCPPHMAYGAQGSPPVIPPNSTLVFEVELKKVT